MDQEEARAKFGQRVQRCNTCYAAFYLKDMWLGAGGVFCCEGCKDDSMFHFEEFSSRIDLTKLPSLQGDAEEITQCQNPFSRQV